MVLLDEMEKAHPDVAMILLQILDEGVITDSQGRKVDFKNTIICLTSNLGSSILAQPGACAADGTVLPSTRTAVLERITQHFPPELINRLDAMLVFNKLSPESILRVVDMRLEDVQARLRDRALAGSGSGSGSGGKGGGGNGGRGKGVTLDVDGEAREWLAGRGYSEVYGARAIARIVRTEVLFPLAKKLLRGTIRDGDTAVVRVDKEMDVLEVRDNHPENEGAGATEMATHALEQGENGLEEDELD